MNNNRYFFSNGSSSLVAISNSLNKQNTRILITNFICEEKIDNQWSMIENDFGEEEKQLTLKILSTAAETSKEVI